MIWIFIIGLCISCCIWLYRDIRKTRDVGYALGYVAILAVCYAFVVGIGLLGHGVFNDQYHYSSIKEQGRSDIDPKFIVDTDCDHVQVGIYRCTNKWVNDSMKDTMSVKIVKEK